MIAALLANWKLVLAGLALAAGIAWHLKATSDAYDRGAAETIAAQSAITREKTDAARRADDAAVQCSLDPTCRLSNDGYRRD